MKRAGGRSAGPEGAGRRFVRFLAEDLSWGLRDLLVNGVGGFILTPRAVRYLLYRAAGLDIRTPGIYPDCTFLGYGRVHIGKGSFINRECYFEAVDDISIGRDVAVAMQVLFVTSTHPFGTDGRFDPVARGRPIRVGDRCWLGARVTVLPGVTIGDDVVVAAGAVVTKDCAPRGLYAGVPAVRIRDLPRGQGTGSAEAADAAVFDAARPGK